VIVLDASAVLELLLKTEGGEAVQRRIAGNQTLHAPHLVDVEVAQVLRRYCASEALDGRRAAVALQDLMALDVHRYSHEPMLGRIWELRANLTAYDAAYVALAEVLDACLLTFDARLARAPGHRARVELLNDR
jgi:predicted nucleic acid-binding protein